MTDPGPPAGYRESALGGTWLVARADQHDAVRDALAAETLHRWAGARPGARALQGRGVAWATTLSSGMDVVVRHSRHGGAFAAITGDLFLTPSRAPHELETSLRLRDAGVPTPAVLAYVVYSAFGPLCRADVATAFVGGADFPAAWAAARGPAARDGIVDAVAALLRAMRTGGAMHPDLNVKNVLVAEAGGAPLAYLLDVDRVQFWAGGSNRPAEMNAMRLRESFSKWRRLHGLDFGETHWSRLVEGAGVVIPAAHAWR